MTPVGAGPDPDLDELRRLEAAATPGKWDIADDDIWSGAMCVAIAIDNPETDAEFIAAFRNAAPWLLAQAEAAQRVRAIHQPRTIETWSSVHRDAEPEHVEGDERCTDACLTEHTICDGDGTTWPCSTATALDGAE